MSEEIPARVNRDTMPLPGVPFSERMADRKHFDTKIETETVARKSVTADLRKEIRALKFTLLVCMTLAVFGMGGLLVLHRTDIDGVDDSLARSDSELRAEAAKREIALREHIDSRSNDRITFSQALKLLENHAQRPHEDAVHKEDLK